MPSRVLIIFPGALGDLICLAPTIAAIARRHQNAGIELMARGELAEFAVGRLGIMRAHSIDRREVAQLFRDGVEDDVQSRRYFGVFERIYCFFSTDDPHFRGALLAASRPDVITFHPFRPSTAGHIAAAYLKDVTGDTSLEKITLDPLPRDREDALRALAGIAEPKKFVAIFPGSGSPTKNWPMEKFLALADQINKDSTAVFILGPAEDSLAEFLRAFKHPIVSHQALGTVAAIARMAMAFVGNDSGVSHLAAATGTHGVVLFGPSDPLRWRPLGRVTVIHRTPMESIEVGEVLAAVDATRRAA